MSKSQAAQRYLAIVGPLNRAGDHLNSEINGSTSDAQLQRYGAPFVKAMQSADGKLLGLAQSFAPAATDLKSEVATDQGLASDLEDPSDITAHQLVSDINSTHTAANTVRSDLDLKLSN